MIAIEVRYRWMGLWMRSMKRNAPQSMREMNAEQMRAVTSLYLQRLDAEGFVSRFFGIPKGIIRRMEPFHLYHIIQLVDFTRDESATMSGFVWPELKGIGTAPGENLRGMSFEQFMLVDTHYSAYAVYQKPESLNGMVTAIYAFDHPAVATRIEEMSIEDKMTVFFNWTFIKRWLSQRFPLLFPEADNTKEEPQVVQWLPVFDSFVGNDVAHIYDYKRLEVMDVLRIMNKRIKDYNDHLRKRK